METQQPAESARKATQPRQPRAVRTRDRLLTATRNIVAAEGVAAVTTTRIASETGISVGALYRYFENRDELILAAYDSAIGEVVARCADCIPAAAGRGDRAVEARMTVTAYLAAAEAVAGLPALLRERRRIHPIACDRDAETDVLVTSILAPLFARFAPTGCAAQTGRFQVLLAVTTAMADLYLANRDAKARQFVLDEFHAIAEFALGRLDA
jgi:AcrR family transcriptional regulator